MGEHNIKARSFVKYLYKKSMEDEIMGLSAQLAYFLLLSIFPLLIFGITLLAFLPVSVEGLSNSFYAVVPEEAISIIDGALQSIFETRRGDLLSISIIITLWTASNGMNAIIRALNKAYDVEEKRRFIHNRIISIMLVLGIVMAIGVALVLSVFGNILGEFILNYFQLEKSLLFLWDILRIGISFLLLLFIFAFLYYIAPNRKLKWKEIYIGTFFASLGWVAVSLLFSYYVNNFGNYSATYGSLGGVIVLMIWLYLSGIILILGGEINATIELFKRGKGFYSANPSSQDSG